MTADRTRQGLAALILLCCAVALTLAGFGLRQGARPAAHAAGRTRADVATANPLPTEPLPPVEPLIVREVTPDDARAINAAVPLVSGPVPSAPSFVYTGSADEKERALTCLASVAWYEAGDDAIGEQAVAQVVLNRMRHPAYPKSICGVVFQGSERKTGCQFTFTCDGALVRRPSADAWKRARGVAEKALAGFVFKPVGTATHYHTDWVVPYWSSTLDKIAQIHTHVFFRWRGGWGSPAALSRHYQGPEPLDPRIAWLADPKLVPPGTVAPPTAPGALAAFTALPQTRDTMYVPGLPTAALKGSVVRLMDLDRTEFGLELDPATFPGSYAIVALAICKGRLACTVMGWTKLDRIPPALPVPMAVLRSVSFLYHRYATGGREDIFWNCRQFVRDNAAQCLPGTQPEPAKADGGPVISPLAPVPGTTHLP